MKIMRLLLLILFVVILFVPQGAVLAQGDGETPPPVLFPEHLTELFSVGFMVTLVSWFFGGGAAYVQYFINRFANSLGLVVSPAVNSLLAVGLAVVIGGVLTYVGLFVDASVIEKYNRIYLAILSVMSIMFGGQTVYHRSIQPAQSKSSAKVARG